MLKRLAVLPVAALLLALTPALPVRAGTSPGCPAGTWAWQSSDNEGTWNTAPNAVLGGYKVQNDNWGPGGPQTICANSYSDVQVTSDQDYGTQIVTYPDVGALYTGTPTPLSSFRLIRNYYTETFPADVVGEAADDVWFSRPGDDWGVELMIWQDTHNEDPSYLPVMGHVTLGGQPYTVYSNGPVNGDGTEYIMKLDGPNEPTGQTHILAGARWLQRHGVTIDGVTEAEFGWEIANTNGPETFTLSSYRLVTRCVAGQTC